MTKHNNAVLMIVGLMVVLSFMLTGCYTQLSRPRIDTEDEYQTNTEYEGEEYYQDQEGQDLSEQPEGNTYIYNYYPYVDPYFDSWYYYPYSWRYYNMSYLGPYPDYWWDPYGRGWIPGWYLGYSYYDSWWGGYPRHRNSYYGDYSNPSQRTYAKRPFGRRSIDAADREQRAIDTRSGLAKPQSPTRMDRPATTIASPDLRRKPGANDAIRSPNQAKRVRTNPNIKKPGNVDDGNRQTTVKPRVPVRRTEPQKDSPRSSKSYSKPKMIETAPAQKKDTNANTNRSYKPTQRSDSRGSTPSRSNEAQVSKPSTRSSAPSSHAAPRSSSSSTSSSSKGTSASKSSGSAKTNKK
ncbi:hypothetical protein L0Z72_09870 [candidate division KSB1 bacterium]|nr:hypothetical protein [candidate division KSB1 bacterium]